MWIEGLLAANAFITGPAGTGLRLTPGNTIDSLNGKPYQKKVAGQAGERPYFYIEIPSQNITNRNAMPTFCNTRGPNGDVNVIKEIVFEIIVEWDSLDRNQPNQFRTVFESILLADPTLGFSGVPVRTSGKYTARDLETKSVMGDGASKERKYLVQRIQFPVTVLLDRATLVANAAYNGQ